MAIIAGDQVTVVDITDAYSIFLSTESISFTGTTPDGTTLGTQQTVVVSLSALCGNEVVVPTIDSNSITHPTNISVTPGTYDTSGNYLPITIVASASLTPTNLTTNNVISLPITFGDVSITKQITVSGSFKGNTGAGGTAAYNVLCGNESQSIYCDKDGKVDGQQTITIPFAGYQGTSRVTCSCANPTLPTGFTRVSNTPSSTSADGSLVLRVADNTSLSASGEITLTFTIGSTTFTKKFTYTRSQTGADGAGGSPGTSATSIVCGNDATIIPCTKDGLVTAAMSIVIPFAGYIGTSRAACTVSYSTLPSGMSLASGGNVPATTSADGSLTINVAKDGTLGSASTLSGVITLTFSCNNQTFTRKFDWSKSLAGQTGAQGDKGDKGDDAIVLVVTSSNGTIFKNSNINTTLTAHVYQGGRELSASEINALGTVKWYKNGSSTAESTGITKTITASDVTDKAVYEARLEG